MHLGRNLGLDLVKPDRWLDRLGKALKKDPEDLCRALAEESGDRIGTVEMILWRACSNDVNLLAIEESLCSV
jgi:hypothetical protein